MRSRFHWFPFHPIGIALQNSLGSRIYWFCLLLVLVAKSILLRYGGVQAFVAGQTVLLRVGSRIRHRCRRFPLCRSDLVSRGSRGARMVKYHFISPSTSLSERAASGGRARILAQAASCMFRSALAGRSFRCFPILNSGAGRVNSPSLSAVRRWAFGKPPRGFAKRVTRYWKKMREYETHVR